jgi:hypothetical protein
LLISPLRWWVLGAIVSAAVYAGTPPEPAEKPPPAAEKPPPAQADVPDDGFIEFLGSDDVGDAAWWEFFRKAAPRGDEPRAAPPQDAKK